VQVTVNLHDCKHCDGSGTCAKGPNQTSCLVCAKKHELPFWSRKGQVGLMCGSCGGIGRAEPLTERMNKRIAPMLALLLTTVLLVMISLAAVYESPYFSQILAFSSAIIGSVAGFYFSSNRSNS